MTKGETGLIVTTSQNQHPLAVRTAMEIANELQASYIPRCDRSVEDMQDKYGDGILVVNKQEMKWYRCKGEAPFFFHPGLSVVRIKRILRGDNDIMIQICQLQPGDSFLDCTLGLAADAIVASHAVGEAGTVMGIESEAMLSFLVGRGLKKVQSIPEVASAAKRIDVLMGNHLDWLRSFADNSVDVVYFDPMFRKGITESSSLRKLRGYANTMAISEEAVWEARRVARRRVVLKEHKKSREWERLGFSPVRRENMDVTYGVIDV